MTDWRHPTNDPPEALQDVIILELTDFDEHLSTDLAFLRHSGVWTYTGTDFGPVRVIGWQPTPSIPTKEAWPEALGPYPEPL